MVVAVWAKGVHCAMMTRNIQNSRVYTSGVVAMERAVHVPLTRYSWFHVTVHVVSTVGCWVSTCLWQRTAKHSRSRYSTAMSKKMRCERSRWVALQMGWGWTETWWNRHSIPIMHRDNRNQNGGAMGWHGTAELVFHTSRNSRSHSAKRLLYRRVRHSFIGRRTT